MVPHSITLRSMHRYLIVFTVIITIALNTRAQASRTASRAAPEIVVSGTGSVRLKSDRASVTVAVVMRANSAAAAERQNARRFQPVLSALKRLELVDSAMTTTGYLQRAGLQLREVSSRVDRPPCGSLTAGQSVRGRLRMSRSGVSNLLTAGRRPMARQGEIYRHPSAPWLCTGAPRRPIGVCGRSLLRLRQRPAGLSWRDEFKPMERR